MTKMAAMPIYGKTEKVIFSGTKQLINLKVGMQHWVLEYYQVCLSDDPRMTLTYFTARSILVPYALYGKKVFFQKLS